MAHFPLFLDLTGKTVLIVGDTSHAQSKARLLAPFGAEIRFLDRLSPENLESRPALVILTGENRTEAAALCREKNIPVNSVDDPENCTFFFPSLIRRGECTIGISTAGTAPAAGAALRRQMEDALPSHLEEILPWLGKITARLRKTVPDYHRRADILSRISKEAFQKNRPLTQDEVNSLM